jgi:hypothetical protein
VQHSWAFAELGTLLDLAWARGAEQRCLRLLTRRQAAFGDGALHALDFGYETDLACCWSYSYLLHKYFGKPEASDEFVEPAGARIYPYVSVGVYPTADLVSSVTWFGSRQAVMIVPNSAKALGDFPSFTSYKCNVKENQVSGLGWIRLEGESKPRPFRVDGKPVITNDDNGLTVSFSRTIPDAVTQRVGYYALRTGQVLVFSQWRAVKDIHVTELVDHPFYWMEIPGYLPTRMARAVGDGVWSIDGKLRMQVLGGAGGKAEKGRLMGAVRGTPWAARAGEVLQDSVCVYQAELPGRDPVLASGNVDRVVLGEWTVERAGDGRLTVSR